VLMNGRNLSPVELAVAVASALRNRKTMTGTPPETNSSYVKKRLRKEGAYFEQLVDLTNEPQAV
jgi:hypothetical protein